MYVCASCNESPIILIYCVHNNQRSCDFDLRPPNSNQFILQFKLIFVNLKKFPQGVLGIWCSQEWDRRTDHLKTGNPNPNPNTNPGVGQTHRPPEDRMPPVTGAQNENNKNNVCVSKCTRQSSENPEPNQEKSNSRTTDEKLKTGVSVRRTDTLGTLGTPGG